MNDVWFISCMIEVFDPIMLFLSLNCKCISGMSGTVMLDCIDTVLLVINIIYFCTGYI